MQFICCLFNGELLFEGKWLCEGNIVARASSFAKATSVARVLWTKVASNEGLRLSNNVVQTTEFQQRSSNNIVPWGISDAARRASSKQRFSNYEVLWFLEGEIMRFM